MAVKKCNSQIAGPKKSDMLLEKAIKEFYSSEGNLHRV